MVALKHFDKDDVEGIHQAVADDGGCIALNVLEASVCDQLVSDFDQHLTQVDWGTDELGYKDEFYGDKTKRLHGLFSKSSAMTDVLMHPLFGALTGKMFLESGMSTEVRLSNTELMVLNQDQGVQDFHRDGGSWHRIQRAEKNEILVSANCALTDFTATNGATRVVPGSHLWSEGREPTEDEICLAVMPRGSALIYSGNILHSGGANKESVARYGLYLGYIPSWLRPIENQLVTNKPEDIMTLPEQAQRLLDVSPGGFTVIA
jgi:ectoine hydroxylase-related dioxygenase (phytanoyl-CoA dioxygenase family)